MPLLVEPGGPSICWFVDYHQLKIHIASGHPDELHRIRAVAVVNGKNVRSSEFVDFGSPGTDEKKLRPTVKMRVKRALRASVGGAFVKDLEDVSVYFLLIVDAPIGVREVRLDLIPSDGSNVEALQAAKVMFPPVRYGFIRGNRQVPVSTDWYGTLPSLPDGQFWQFRLRSKGFWSRRREQRYNLS